MRALKFLLLFYCLAVSFTQAGAQRFTISTGVSSIGRNDVLDVAYEIKDGSDISGFLQPDFDDWNVLSGPYTSQRMVSINGQVSKSFSYLFTLSPKRTGKLVLPGTQIVADGKKLTCKSITITVTNKTSVSPATPPSGGGLQPLFNEPALQDLFPKDPALKPGDDPAAIMRENIFVRVTANKTNCYTGEPVLVTYKMYTAVHTEARITKQPAFSGCSVIELTGDQQPLVEKINGKNYRVYLVRKVAVIPLQEGQLTLDALKIENTVNFLENGNPYKPKAYSAEISNPPVALTVMPLPQNGKPAGFTGAVGNFSIKTQLKNATTAVGESNGLLITVSGNGNFQSVEEPGSQWPANTEHFEAAKKEAVDNSSYPVRGSVIFEIPFIALKEGRQIFEPFTWSYFDPAEKTYKTLRTDSLHLTIMKAAPTVSAARSQQQTQDFSNTKYLWIVAGIAVAASILLFFTLRKKETKNAAGATMTDTGDVSLPLPETAPIPVAEPVKTNFAEALANLGETQDAEIFYSLAKQLLHQALKETFNTDGSLQDLLFKLKTERKDDASAAACIEIIRNAEFALYSGMINESNKATTMQKLRDVIDRLGL
ncbi:BatD family protein [Foetidibacter luteolus]|uniref:BatD family protein n=1 Tax=Foetidibacter luteolus TaxID=2608880 RepID=UPI00129BD6CB|nr:BatD family protein [Foetidibacter luteolus]